MGSLKVNRLNVSWLPRINTMELDAMSELEGKTVREAASEWSRRAARDIDGKTERSNGREHMSQCGQRASFKT